MVPRNRTLYFDGTRRFFDRYTYMALKRMNGKTTRTLDVSGKSREYEPNDSATW